MTIRSDGRGGTPNTLIERLGFRDEDRRTPEHDEMVAWLDVQLRTETFLRTLIPDNTSAAEENARAYAAESVDERRQYLEERAAYILDLDAKLAELERWTGLGDPPEVPAPKATKVVWELPVGDSRWIAGFVDLYAIVEIPRLTIASDYCDYEKWKLPVWSISRGNSVDSHRAFGFEVKSAIPSVGDLIRQIRFYETKWVGEYASSHAPPFYCVSQHGKHAPTLAAQGIGFVHYPTAKIVPPEQS